MPNPENGNQEECNVLPFDKQGDGETAATSTTLAALLAVTVSHDAGDSAERRLIEIIEQSGEAEVLDTEDVLANLGIETERFYEAPQDISSANDNSPVAMLTE